MIRKVVYIKPSCEYEKVNVERVFCDERQYQFATDGHLCIHRISYRHYEQNHRLTMVIA